MTRLSDWWHHVLAFSLQPSAFSMWMWRAKSRANLLWQVSRGISPVTCVVGLPHRAPGLRQLARRRPRRFQGRWLLGFAVFFLPVFLVSWASEAAEKDQEPLLVTKEVTGTISAVRPTFLNIVYEKNAERGIEYEIPLKVDKDVQVRNRASLKDLAIGDRVKVTYAEAQEQIDKRTPEGGIERVTKILSRKATIVTYLPPVQRDLISGGGR